MNLQNNNFELKSYEVYKEIADDLCAPVDEKLPAHVRYELYSSKLVYLKNLYEQCFKEVNIYKDNEATFSEEDLHVIQQAMDFTKDYLRRTIVESVIHALSHPAPTHSYSVKVSEDENCG